MIRKSEDMEWPLATFTIGLQVALALAFAATIGANSDSISRATAFRACGIAVFPTAAGALLISMLHLGSPGSAWRAFINIHQSRLSREVLFTLLFALTAALSSIASLAETRGWILLTSATASLFGLAAVVASATIYTIPTRLVWNSGWVPLSFIASSISFSGIALLFIGDSPIGINLALVGSALLLIADVWIGRKSIFHLNQAPLFLIWTILHMLVTISAMILLLTQLNGARTHTLVVVAVLSITVVTGRMLMFAAGRIEQRF